ncbi:MAG: hypothetical protein EZS28_017968 [Streblomastix strix]|uniref:Uncharacterized protein n=1 Tax=Streblomastix strix TaxID=222440 RepID=A0A5J4VVE0_9EUKA|nr:MAG: hypothetical protein EZS28_017968 [Streblomastix strix]
MNTENFDFARPYSSSTRSLMPDDAIAARQIIDSARTSSRKGTSRLLTLQQPVTYKNPIRPIYSAKPTTSNR